MAQADHITQTNSLQTHIKSLEVRTVRTRVSFYIFLVTFFSHYSFSSTYSMHFFISLLLFIAISYSFIFLTFTVFLQAEMQRQRDQCATLKSNLSISDSDLKTRITELEIVKKKYGFTFHNESSQNITISTTHDNNDFHYFYLILFSLLLKEEIAETAQLQLAEVSSDRQRLRDTSEALDTQLKNVLNTRYCMSEELYLVELSELV